MHVTYGQTEVLKQYRALVVRDKNCPLPPSPLFTSENFTTLWLSHVQTTIFQLFHTSTPADS